MKLTQTIKNVNMRLASVIAVSAAIVGIGIGSQVMAWGPERPTTSGETGADYITFNSITDNKKVGNERNFVRIREAGVGDYVNEMQLQPGKQYEVMNYYHNNAKTSLNASGAGIAKDVTLRTKMPSVVKPGERGTVSGIISASNANPREVWDEAFVTSSVDVALKYLAGSAKVTSNGPVNGQVLPDTVFSTGALLGYDSLNGVLPGCAEYSGFIVYKFRVDAPNFTVVKQVSPTDKKQWQKSYTAQPGEKVDYKVTYTNTGTTAQNDVNIRDVLPKGMAYVAGSTKLYNTANPGGLKVSDNIFTSGINIGNYAAGGNAVVIYSATVAAQKDLACGANTLTNNVAAITSGGSKSDAANVKVDVKCAPNECKPGIPAGDARCGCVPKQGEVVDAKGNCVTPVGTLPTTGPAEVIMSLVAVAAVTFGIVYYLRSRRDLQNMLHEVHGQQGATTLGKTDAATTEKDTKEKSHETAHKK